MACNNTKYYVFTAPLFRAIAYMNEVYNNG